MARNKDWGDGDDSTTYDNNENSLNDFLKALLKHWLDIMLHPKDYTYALMSPYNNTYATERSFAEMAYSINNKDEIVNSRNFNPRNLASLYVYGNDLGLFEEAPQLKYKGVEYDTYLKAHGRDPLKIITYKGNIPIPVILPEQVKDNIIDYINSSANKTWGAHEELQHMDNVAGFLQRLSLDELGNPIVVNSDLWDFEPDSYASKWKAPYWQAWALDKMGTPFILKDILPILYVTLDDFYGDSRYNDYWTKQEASRNIAKLFGFGIPVTVTYNNDTNEQTVSGKDENGQYKEYKRELK